MGWHWWGQQIVDVDSGGGGIGTDSGAGGGGGIGVDGSAGSGGGVCIDNSAGGGGIDNGAGGGGVLRLHWQLCWQRRW